MFQLLSSHIVIWSSPNRCVVKAGLHESGEVRGWIFFFGKDPSSVCGTSCTALGVGLTTGGEGGGQNRGRGHVWREAALERLVPAVTVPALAGGWFE